LTAFCPLRKDSQPVSPTAAKICRTNGNTNIRRRDTFFLERFDKKVVAEVCDMDWCYSWGNELAEKSQWI
jgi:hypothetical protein